MAVCVRVSGDIYNAAKWTSAGENRSISAQIEFWAKIGRAALDNPDLPIEFIRDVLISKTQNRMLAEKFSPDES